MYVHCVQLMPGPVCSNTRHGTAIRNGNNNSLAQQRVRPVSGFGAVSCHAMPIAGATTSEKRRMKSAHVFLNFSYIIHSGSGLAMASHGRTAQQLRQFSSVRFNSLSPRRTLLCWLAGRLIAVQSSSQTLDGRAQLCRCRACRRCRWHYRWNCWLLQILVLDVVIVPDSALLSTRWWTKSNISSGSCGETV